MVDHGDHEAFDLGALPPPVTHRRTPSLYHVPSRDSNSRQSAIESDPDLSSSLSSPPTAPISYLDRVLSANLQEPHMKELREDSERMQEPGSVDFYQRVIRLSYFSGADGQVCCHQFDRTQQFSDFIDDVVTILRSGNFVPGVRTW